MLPDSEMKNVLDEGNQLTAIFVSSLKTVNARLTNTQSKI